MKIFPSIFSFPILELKNHVQNSKDAGFYLDLSYGVFFINQIRQEIDISKKFIVTLNVDYPEESLYLLNLNPGDIVAVFQENSSNLKYEQLIQDIRNKNYRPSIAIVPTTPIDSLISLQVHFDHTTLFGAEDDVETMAKMLNILRTSNEFKLDIAAVVNSKDDTVVKKLEQSNIQDLITLSNI